MIVSHSIKRIQYTYVNHMLSVMQFCCLQENQNLHNFEISISAYLRLQCSIDKVNKLQFYANVQRYIQAHIFGIIYYYL